MMNIFEQLDKRIEENGGMIQTFQIVETGISKQCFESIWRCCFNDNNTKNYSYADDVSWHMVMNSVRALYQATALYE